MNLRGFPRRTLRGDRTLFRIHREERAPWWFSSDGSGQFDPIGTDLGACYLAERDLGAWIEVFHKRLLLAEEEITQRALFCVELGRDLRLADLTSRRALQFGVTASLGADERYEPSQAFAVSAAQAGFDGIRYLARHDPAQELHSVALFAPAGTPGPGDPRWPPGRHRPILEELIRLARQLFGDRILPTP